MVKLYFDESCVLTTRNAFSFAWLLCARVLCAAGRQRPAHPEDADFCFQGSANPLCCLAKGEGVLCHLLSQAKAGRQRPLGNGNPG